jgi:hypothetical protein
MAAIAALDINGQKVGLRFGLSAIQRIGDDLPFGKDLTGNDLNIFFLKTVLFNGYLTDCYAKNIVPVLTREDFHDFIEQSAEELNMDQIKTAVEVYTRSKEITEERATKAAEAVDEKKNNLVGMM